MPRPSPQTTAPAPARAATVPPAPGAARPDGALEATLARAVAQRAASGPVPGGLRQWMEAAGGVDLADVRVHPDSPRPGRHGADAYAAGRDIFLGPAGGDLLAHELWHVVQQRQGRAAPTARSAGLAVNDDPRLEREADAVAAGRAPATPAAAVSAPPSPVAQFGRGKGKKKQAPAPKLVSVEDTSSRDVAANLFQDDAELKTLMREAALAAMTTYAYHATRSSNAPSILSQGLDPSYGGTGAAKGQDEFEEHSKSKIHYTRKVGLAEDYKRYFEGDAPFGPTRRVDAPAPAEVLQVAVHASLLASERVDEDSKKYDLAFTNTRAVPPAYLRSLEPTPITPGSGETELPTLKRKALRAMLVQGAAETDALWSHLSARGRGIVDDIVEDSRDLDREAVMQMVRMGLHSFRLEDLVDFETLLRLGAANRAHEKPTGAMYGPKDRWQ